MLMNDKRMHDSIHAFELRTSKVHAFCTGVQQTAMELQWLWHVKNMYTDLKE